MKIILSTLLIYVMLCTTHTFCASEQSTPSVIVPLVHAIQALPRRPSLPAAIRDEIIDRATRWATEHAMQRRARIHRETIAQTRTTVAQNNNA